jgi:DNA ligase-1
MESEMTSKSLAVILDELKATKGSIAKAAILNEHKGREDLKRLVQLTYEPTISFYMKPQKLPFLAPHVATLDGIEGCEAIYNTLASRRLTGHAAKAFYENTITSCTHDAAILVNVMMERDFRCGVGDTTINKIWPGIITETPYMRCALPATAKITKWPWGTPGFFAYSQPKADGMFANVTVTSAVAVSSRNGQTFAGGGHFDAVSSIAATLSTVIGYAIQLHGEFVVRKGGKLLPRELGNGIMNSLLNDGVLEKDAELVYVFWDCVPVSSLAVKRYDVDYRDRYESVETALNTVFRTNPALNDKSDVFQLMESRIVKTYPEAVEHFIERTMAGEEGTVVKKSSMIWFDGDSMEQVKMKITFAVELRVKGFNAGNQNGRHAKTFGSLQCESEDGLLATGVSGMSDALRKTINDNREFYIDKVVTVSSNNVMMPSKSNARHSMFLPRLEEIRADKTVADTLPSILAQFEAAKKGEEVVGKQKPV